MASVCELPLKMEIEEEQWDGGANIEVSTHHLESPYKGSRIRMHLGRRQIQILEDPALIITEC